MQNVSVQDTERQQVGQLKRGDQYMSLEVKGGEESVHRDLGVFVFFKASVMESSWRVLVGVM